MSKLDDILYAIRDAEVALNAAAKELDQLTVELESASPSDNAVSYWEVREAYEKLDETRKRIYANNDKQNKLLVPQALEKAELDLIRIPALGRSFSIQKKYSATIIDGKKDEAHQWLRDNGLGAIIQPTVNAQTLTTSLKDLILGGKDAPEEYFNFRSYNTTGSNKYTPK